MRHSFLDYQCDDDRGRIDWPRVHGWLASSYWSPGISLERLRRGADASALAAGIYDAAGNQAGFARVVSDTTRFAYLCDVWIAEEHRGRGLGRALVRFILDHPLFAEIDRWCLRTEDAHGVYAELGFIPSPAPECWMEYKPRRPSS